MMTNEAKQAANAEALGNLMFAYAAAIRAKQAWADAHIASNHMRMAGIQVFRERLQDFLVDPLERSDAFNDRYLTRILADDACRQAYEDEAAAASATWQVDADLKIAEWELEMAQVQLRAASPY